MVGGSHHAVVVVMLFLSFVRIEPVFACLNSLLKSLPPSLSLLPSSCLACWLIRASSSLPLSTSYYQPTLPCVHPPRRLCETNSTPSIPTTALSSRRTLFIPTSPPRCHPTAPPRHSERASTHRKLSDINKASSRLSPSHPGTTTTTTHPPEPLYIPRHRVPR